MIKLCAFADEAAESLEEQISELKKNEISLLELRSIDKKNVSEFTDDEAKSYAKTLKKAGIKVWSIGSPLGKVDISDAIEHMKTVRRVCEIAKIFDAERIRMFSFFNAYESPEDVFKALEEMSAIAGEYGLILCHENEKEIYGDTLPRIRELIDGSIPNIRFVFDPANYIQCGVDVREALNALYEKSDYFHIKDVIASTGELVPSGYGDGQIDLIIEKTKKSDKTVVLTLEPHLALFAGYDKIDNTVMKHKFEYKSSAESFFAASNALKQIILKHGYKQTEKGFELL